MLISDHPDRKVPTDSLGHRLREAGRLQVTWELSALYAIGFGGIVAFGVYLPTYLKTWYDLSPTDAGFMLLSDLALAGCVYAYGRMRNIQRDQRMPEPAV